MITKKPHMSDLKMSAYFGTPCTMHVMRIIDAFASTLCKTSNGLLFKDSICLITSSLSLGYGFKKISI